MTPRTFLGGSAINLMAAALAVIAQAWSSDARAETLEAPSGMITSISGGPDYTYTMTFADGPSATEPIGTIWFAWVPGKDFLPTSPLSETSPSGWTVNAITHAGASDGYAIRWEATSAANDIPIGGTLSGFSFTTTDTPSAINGNSPFYPGTPVLTTFAYDAGPFSDAGTQFVVADTPLPRSSYMGIALLPIAWLLCRARRRGARQQSA